MIYLYIYGLGAISIGCANFFMDAEAIEEDKRVWGWWVLKTAIWPITLGVLIYEVMGMLGDLHEYMKHRHQVEQIEMAAHGADPFPNENELMDQLMAKAQAERDKSR
jgi:hypothetical protein